MFLILFNVAEPFWEQRAVLNSVQRKDSRRVLISVINMGSMD